MQFTTLTHSWTARGRVGAHGASLVARQMAPDTVRVECRNNTRFWLVVDVDTRTAHGAVKGMFRPGTAAFAVRATPRGLRVDHPQCPWFWLELEPDAATPAAAAAKAKQAVVTP